MDYKILEQNNPNNEEYFLTILLRNLKELDYSLTRYLVEDFYREEEITRTNVMDDVAKISNICNFILKETQYDKDYYDDFMEEKIIHANNIHNAWCSLCKIRQLLESYVDQLGIRMNLNLGFSFNSCNFASLEILYREKINDYSIHTFHLLTITTHDGKDFQIHKCRSFYEKSSFPLDEYRKNINTTFTYDDIDKVIAKVSELCLDFKENLLEEVENASH